MIRLTEEQAAMVDLLDDMGMTMEAIEFAEECYSNESLKKLLNKANKHRWDITDSIDDLYDKIPYRKQMCLSKHNPFHKYNEKYYKEKEKRDLKRKQEQMKESFDMIDFDLDII